ncbi:MAG TPA: hypothetical protein VGP68_14050, partial [Gemmataceae bacterium]|nr:hypothetical protein [Gemmataceae bacterium]
MGRQADFCKAKDKGAFCFELLVAKPKTLAVVRQELERRAAAIAEDKDSAQERILVKGFPAELGQAVN